MDWLWLLLYGCNIFALQLRQDGMGWIQKWGLKFNWKSTNWEICLHDGIAVSSLVMGRRLECGWLAWYELLSLNLRLNGLPDFWIFSILRHSRKRNLRCDIIPLPLSLEFYDANISAHSLRVYHLFQEDRHYALRHRYLPNLFLRKFPRSRMHAFLTTA